MIYPAHPIDAVSNSTAIRPQSVANDAPSVLAARQSMPQVSTKEASANRDFEAFVLQSFIEAMLPEASENVFGKGIAGETWKSMLAETLAKQLSLSGQTGIAQRLASASPARSAGEVTVPAPSGPGMRMARGSEMD